MSQTKKNPLDYVRPCIKALEPYSTARDEFKGGDISVWIDANENPFDNGVNRYPDPHHKELRRCVSALKDIPGESLFFGGAGSDEAIDLTFRIFCTPGKDNAIAITPSYGVYKVSADVNDVELREVQLNEDFSLPVDKILAAADANSKLIWICSPNNPTANAFPPAQILELCEKFNGMVVVDEAYVDFSGLGSMVSAIESNPNMIVLQTFSKAWGMAGLRLGMAIAVPAIIDLYNRVKYPYNINGPTQKEVINRIRRSEVHRAVATILEERDKLERGLKEADCVETVYPSDANFLLVKVSDANAVYDHLIEGGVIVRNRSKLPGCKNCLRVTVGTPEENIQTLKLFKTFKSPSQK